MVCSDDSLLELLPMPGWLLRRDGVIEKTNALASSLARRMPGVLSVTGRLRRIGSLEIKPELIERLEPGASLRHTVALAGDKVEFLRATVHFMASGAGTISVLAILLMHTSDAEDDETWFALLAARFGLTRTETSVFALLTANADVRDIAQAHAIGAATVRTHLRALRDKTGRRSQVELVRLGLGR